MPRVSVGLPVYNRERYLRTSIESILGQTYRDFELIIADNASTDNTERICREYAEKDDRVRYHRNAKNIGAPRNFNLAFELSTGEYLKWATSDDYVTPDMLEKCVRVMDEHPDVVLCYPNAQLIDAEGKFLGYYDDVLNLQQSRPSERFIQLLTTIKLAHQHLGVIRSSMLRQTSMHADFIAADINFLAELTLYGKFYELPEYLLFRRFHPDSSSWERGSRERQVQFSDPARGGRIRLDNWESTCWFFNSVRRAPVPLSEKIVMYRFLLRRAYWRKGNLGRELTGACAAYWRRVFGSSPQSTKT